MFQHDVTSGTLPQAVVDALEVLNDELVTFEDASEILGIIPQYTRRTLNEQPQLTRVTIAGKAFFVREEIVDFADGRTEAKANRSQAAQEKKSAKDRSKAETAAARESRAATRAAAKLLKDAEYDADDQTAANAVSANQRRKNKGGKKSASFGADVDAAINDILAEDAETETEELVTE